MYKKTTTVPNAVFDFLLPSLTGTELKILLVIIRQTLGWIDTKSINGRKTKDWIAGSQLQAKTGASPRAITAAIDGLVQKELIMVYDLAGNVLSTPTLRKGKTKLLFELTPSVFKGVEKQGNKLLNSIPTSAQIAGHISRNVHQLAQKMRITKETLQN